MKLVVSKTCPFAQRAWITANALDLKCDIEIINLQDKPEWFLQLTEFAKVPVLIDDKKRVLWESIVVANYLNEVQGYPLSPADRFTNAVNEAWMQHVGGVQSSVYKIASSENASIRHEAASNYQAQLQPLEKALNAEPYFNGKQFCMIDILYAVPFIRAKFIAEHYQLNLYAELPKIAAWAEQLVNHPAVQASTVPDFLEWFGAKYFT